MIIIIDEIFSFIGLKKKIVSFNLIDRFLIKNKYVPSTLQLIIYLKKLMKHLID